MQAILPTLVVLLAALSLSQVTVWWTSSGSASGWHQWGLGGTLVLLGGVLAAYALDAAIDARAALARQASRWPFALIAAGAVGLAVGLLIEPRHLPLAVALAVTTAAYVPIKRWVPKGIPNAIAWGAATVWLPTAQPIPFNQGAPLALCIALIVLANAILCDTLDVDADRAAGVKSITVWLGHKRAARGAFIVAAAASAAAVRTSAAPLLASAIPLAMTALFMNPGDRTRQRLALDAMILAPGLLLLLTQM